MEGRFVLGGLAHDPFEVGADAEGVVVSGNDLEVVVLTELLTVVQLEFIAVFAVGVANGLLDLDAGLGTGRLTRAGDVVAGVAGSVVVGDGLQQGVLGF